MQNKLNQFLFTILFSLWGLGGFAQTYPVTIYSQFTYPTPIYLSNYANRTTINSPLRVQLMLNDLTIMNRQIRLKLYFSGTSGYLMSKDYVIGAQPLYLQGGFPLQLTNVELGPYFELQNLLGVNPNQYGQPLGEGTYDFCVEVYDFATNKKLSKKTCVSTVIFQNDPPILNLPVNQVKIMRQDIQNIIFNWTPRNTNVGNVEYEFSLVELWNPNIPYQTAFDYAPPLYTETTRLATLQYDMSKPQLIPGKSYAWRVKAKALKGAEEIGMFKNNGFSEIFTFKYLSQCNAPMNVTTEGVSQDQAKIKWTGITTNSFDYQVNYREKNARSKWYSIITPREYTTITNLKPNTAYEYTVGTACDKGEYTLGSINEFTTLAKDEIAFAGCGIKPDLADLLNQTPLPALYPNDVVTAGDFPIVVLHASGGNGTFSGDGFVTLPFINKFKEKIGGTIDANSDQNVGIRITFNNIGVNTDFKLISGEIVASYDANWGSMIDVDKLAEEIDNFLKNYKGTDEDKAKALEFHKKQEERSSDLLADANLSQEEKAKILEANKNALDSWTALENANPCGGNKNTDDKAQKGGPNADYYIEEDNFDCYKTPIENETRAIEAAADKVDALACSMPELTRGCPANGPLETGMNDGDWEADIKTLNELKKAINNQTPYTYTKDSSFIVESQISIGTVCFDKILFDYSEMKEKTKTVDKVAFSKELTKSVAVYEYWTLDFNGVLKIKIQKKMESGKDISKAKIDLLEKWLKCGGKPKEETKDKTYQPPSGSVDVKLLSLSPNGEQFLIKQEAVITHVYNDAKGGFSKYCTEHEDHTNTDWFCTKSNHYVIDKKGKSVLGKPTIGLGHLITSQTELDKYCSATMTKEDCMTLFKEKDLPRYEGPLKEAVSKPLTQYQYDALLSFVFNTGTNGLEEREIFKLIKKGDYDSEDVKIAMSKWNSPSIVIPRRNDEINLFNTGEYTFRGNEIK